MTQIEVSGPVLKKDNLQKLNGKDRQDSVSASKASSRGLNSSRVAHGKYEPLIDTGKTPQSSLNNSGRIMNATVEITSPQTVEENSLIKSKDRVRKGHSFDHLAQAEHAQPTEKRFQIVRYNLLDLKRQRDDSPANSLIRERQNMNKTNQ